MNKQKVVKNGAWPREWIRWMSTVLSPFTPCPGTQIFRYNPHKGGSEGWNNPQPPSFPWGPHWVSGEQWSQPPLLTTPEIFSLLPVVCKGELGWGQLCPPMFASNKTRLEKSARMVSVSPRSMIKGFFFLKRKITFNHSVSEAGTFCCEATRAPASFAPPVEPGRRRQGRLGRALETQGQGRAWKVQGFLISRAPDNSWAFQEFSAAKRGASSCLYLRFPARWVSRCAPSKPCRGQSWLPSPLSPLFSQQAPPPAPTHPQAHQSPLSGGPSIPKPSF